MFERGLFLVKVFDNAYFGLQFLAVREYIIDGAGVFFLQRFYEIAAFYCVIELLLGEGDAVAHAGQIKAEILEAVIDIGVF